MINEFFLHLAHYTKELVPVLAIGFLLSGIIHEFIPQEVAEKYFNKKGILPIIYLTILGIILPVCCFGSLPIAVTLRKKGVRLGPILAFLVATPATSISAILVTLKIFGLTYTIYLCLTVIFMGLTIGIIGNFLRYPEVNSSYEGCPMCAEGEHLNHYHHTKKISQRIVSVLSYSFIDLPKEIGIEIIIGLILAAVVASFKPFEILMRKYLVGIYSYIFSLIFGLLMYICSTASVVLVNAFTKIGLNYGASLVMLIAGPVTSWGTILVIKKEFGIKVLIVYLLVISIISLVSGYLYQAFLIPK
jgi:uncharacterized membrane protein YraQ (UPF0718 family)